MTLGTLREIEKEWMIAGQSHKNQMVDSRTSPLVNLGRVPYYDRMAILYMYSSIHWAKLTESQIFTLSA